MKYFLSLLLIFSFLNTLQAQDWMGLHSSNYAGVQGISYNPASIADSRYKFQMNIIGFSTTASNSYYAIPNGDLFSDIEFERLITSDKSNERGGLSTIDVHAPLSFMLSMSPKHSFGFTARARAVINIDGITSENADFVDRLIDSDNFEIDPNDSFDASGLYANVHGWAEYGITYARVILDDETRFLKAGGTFKLLDGVASGYAYSNTLRFNGLSDDFVDVVGVDVETGFSDNISFGDEDDENFEYNTFSNFGVGFDLGVVYEFRPDMGRYRYEMDGEENLIRRDKNKYKYKIGFSILDIGGIKYDKSNDSGNITGSSDNIDVNNLEGDADEIFEDLFNYERGGSYKMSLPTRLMADFDYNVIGKFYTNVTTQLALKGGFGDKEKSKYVSTLSLTPRVEGKILGFGLPLSYDKFSNFNTGFSLRLGPVVIGSRDAISTFVFGKDPKSADVHFALRIGIPYKKKKDRDNDGISNKKDICPRVPGVWEFKGCPDRDADGIQDSEDACADTPGIAALQGCPDTDEDGIKDSEDACPEVAGITQFNGCPDTDGDGVKDSEDQCPEVPGKLTMNGCPDMDSDGVIDSKDLCPELAGPIEKNGCPDSDNDGIYDNEDKCPTQAGAIENSGCPYNDSDGDGIIDKEDECILIPGTVENNGCPEIKEEEQEILNTAFSNLEFELGKAKIAISSYTSLVELANLLKLKTDWRLRIDGYTDSTGSRTTNMKLSKARAQAVADFLKAQGISTDRFSVYGYGPDNPVADNATKAGREQNRRVELNVVFE